MRPNWLGLTKTQQSFLVKKGVDCPTNRVNTEFTRQLRLRLTGIPKMHEKFLANQCVTLYKNNWKNPDGSPAIVPVEAFFSEHHSVVFEPIICI